MADGKWPTGSSAAVLAEPPEAQRAEDGGRFVGVICRAVGRRDIGPDDRVTVEDGGAVGQPPPRTSRDQVGVCLEAFSRRVRVLRLSGFWWRVRDGKGQGIRSDIVGLGIRRADSRKDDWGGPPGSRVQIVRVGQIL